MNDTISREIVRKLYYSAIDVKERLLGQRGELTPPKRLRVLIGESSGYRDVGNEFFKYFVSLCGLKPDERVLDVGCGVGRLAAPLTQYLSKSGSYEGLDILSEGIDWASKNITPRFPNFHFHLADVYNKRYNSNGRQRASEFKFPFESDSFDFVFLTSVFTHMLPKDIENYLSEITRVMKKNGRCLITFFLINQLSLKLIEEKRSSFDFKHLAPEGYRTISLDEPEAAIAYEEEFVRSLFEQWKLPIEEPIRYGSWSGRKDFLSFQDIIIAKKE